MGASVHILPAGRSLHVLAAAYPRLSSVSGTGDPGWL